MAKFHCQQGQHEWHSHGSSDLTGWAYSIVIGIFSLGASLGVQPLHILELMGPDKTTGSEPRTIQVTCRQLWNMHQKTWRRGFDLDRD